MKAIKVKLYPSNKQKVLIEKHFGCSRFAYNFGLEKKIKTYTETKKSISIYEIQKEIPKLKEEKPWLGEVNAQSLQQSLKDLDSAFSHFFRKNNAFPKFKSKYDSIQSFRVPQSFEISKDRKAIKIPKIKWIKFRDKFNILTDVEFRNITISRSGQEYFASICYDDKKTKPELAKITEKKTLGIDLGVTILATFSNGEKVENPKHFKKYQDKLALEQQKLSKIVNKEFKSYQKQKNKVNKIYKKISNVRKDFLHKLSKTIVKNQDYTSIAIEDLSVKTMLQDNASPMSKAIGDASWRMLRTMLAYKTEDYGKNLLIIGRFEASSKTCSNCGNVYHELDRNEKEWTCSHCGVKHDRDINAAKNIKNFALVKSLGKGFSERKQA